MTTTDVLPESLREALGHVVAAERRNWQRERALIEAESRAAIAELRAQIVELTTGARAMVQNAVANIPAPRDGKDADPAEIERMIAEAVARIPAPQDGKDADRAVVAALVASEVEKAVSGLPAPQDGAPGKDADPVSDEQIRAAVVEYLEANPPAAGRDGADGKDGQDGAPGKDGRDGVDGQDGAAGRDGLDVDMSAVEAFLAEKVDRAVAAIPRPKDGAPGKLPIAKAWTDAIHYESDVVTHEGATYQAQRDTAKTPPHEDWICLAGRGEDGQDGRSLTIRGTWAASEAYRELDVVALNGGSFVARRDDPGPCPGPGWQLVVQGKKGEPGKDARGLRGDPGPPVVAGHVDGEGLLTLVNGDGSRVEVDLYPVLEKVAAR